MPLYVYKCQKCDQEFEKMAKVSDPLPKCPTRVDLDDGNLSLGWVPCDGETVKIPGKGGSFHLKGSGWASDGYS